ncbi:MAG: TraR/DksA C4-type zinc finger protein [Jatrophihabitantaceae bacterium]
MSPSAKSASRGTSTTKSAARATSTTKSAARGTSTIGAEQLSVLRGMLDQQRQFRLEQLEQLRRSDELDLLSGNDIQISASLTAGARAALRDVVEALHRMDEGRYGRCRRCDTHLPIERLEILPQVALCMNCQRANESP